MHCPSLFETLPKVELHLHLDCSLSYNVVSRINPDIKLGHYKNQFIAPEKCNDLADKSYSMNGYKSKI